MSCSMKREAGGAADLRDIQALSECDQDLLVVQGFDACHISLVGLPFCLVLPGREQQLSNAGCHQGVLVMRPCIHQVPNCSSVCKYPLLCSVLGEHEWRRLRLC